MGLGTLAMAVAETSGVLFAGRFVIGAGATVTFIGAIKLGAAWFPPERFGTISASPRPWACSARSSPPPPWPGSWPWWAGGAPSGSSASCTLAGAALCLAVVRDHPARDRRRGAGSHAREVFAGTLAVLRNPHTWPPFLAFFFLYAAMGNLMLWAVPFLRDVYGLGMTQAALYATATPLALLASGPLTGWLSDSVLRRRKLPFVALSAAQLALWGVFAGTTGASRSAASSPSSSPWGWWAARSSSPGPSDAR